MNLNHTQFPVLLRLPPPPLWHSIPSLKEEEQEKKKISNMCCWCTHWSVVSLLVVSPLKKTKSFPRPYQKLWIVKSYTSTYLSQSLSCFGWISAWAVTIWGWGVVEHDGGVRCHRSLLYASFSPLSLQSSIPWQKKLSCPLQSEGAVIIDLDKVPGNNAEQELQTSTWSPLPAHATDLSVFSVAVQILNINTDCHSPQRQHCPLYT